LSQDMLQLAEHEVFKSTKEMVEESINNPGMELDFSELLDSIECG